MADYPASGSALRNSRTDQGRLESRYARELIDMAVVPRLPEIPVTKTGGMFFIESRTAYATDALASHTGVRLPNAEIPVGQAGAITSYAIQCADFGKAASYDTLDELILRSDPDVMDEVFAVKAQAHCVESMDYALAAKLSAAINPWTATEVDCSGSPWSGAVTACTSQLQSAVTSLDWAPNAVILSFKAATYLRGATDVTANYRGNKGAGRPLDDALWPVFWASLGVSKVLVGGTDSIGATVTLVQLADDPRVEPSGLAFARFKNANEDSDGYLRSRVALEHERKVSFYCTRTGQVLLYPALGVRLVSVY